MTETTPRYPAQYECDVVLRDGSTLHVRPIRRDDARNLMRLYLRLSPESLRFRFFTVPGRDPALAQRLATVDYVDSFALVGELDGQIWAVARYVRDPNAPDRAEVAFVTADALQGRGIGTRLLEQLAEIARDNGIRVFDAHVMAENMKMLRVFVDSGFEVHKRLTAGEYIVSLSLEASEASEARAALRSQTAAAASMRVFFEPRSIAVVGANRERGRIGSEILHNLRHAGFAGGLVAINPKATEIDGVASYPDLAAVPGPVDVAIIAVPAPAVPAAVDQAVAKGVRGLVVISAGFGETGPEGRQREARLVEAVRRAGVRMIGPNCMGLINTDPAVRLNATFAPTHPPPGSVALLSQSGALGLAILDYAARLNIGISTFVSVGNKADVSSNDLIQYWAEDPRTRVILLYLESFGNPRNFTRLAARVAPLKPIVAVKAGRSRAGARAAASHTGALATSDVIVDAMFRQTGVIRVETLEELFGTAALVANQPLPRGPRVAILTNAGGPAILAADACQALGLELATLSDQSVEALRGFLPPAASVANPVDMLAAAPPDAFERALRILLADPDVDSIIVIFIPPLVTRATEVATAVRSAVSGATKPVLATFMGTEGMHDQLPGIPCYVFPEAAAAALAHATTHQAWRDRRAIEPAPGDVPDVRSVRQLVKRALERGGGWLRPEEVADVLAAIDVPLARAEIATTADDAVRAAKALAGPVALKAIGPDILHKTDVGGVLLDVAGDEAVRHGYDELRSRLGTRLRGVLVQAMVPGGVEMVVGATTDPTFGPVVLCGSGGTLVELLEDTAVRLVPVSDFDVREMIEELRGVRLLRGFRGAPPSDEAALRRAVVGVSTLIEECPEIQEMDLNPVKVLTSGLRVVDARIRVAAEQAPQPSKRIVYA